MRLDRRAGQVSKEHRWFLRRSTSVDHPLLDMALQLRSETKPATSLREMNNPQAGVVLMPAKLSGRHRRWIMLSEQCIDCGINGGESIGHGLDGTHFARSVPPEWCDLECCPPVPPPVPLRSTPLERAACGRLQEEPHHMTVDESTTLRSAQPIVRQFTAEHDQLLHAVVTQLERVTARLDVLEAREAAANSAPANATTPAWRTKNGRQTGWQPARR